MAANVLQNHNHNPYWIGKKGHNAVILTAKGPYANALVMLSPIAIKVLLILASELKIDGYSSVTLDDLAYRMRTSRSYANKGILELAKMNLIRKKKRSEYWLNPNSFRPTFIDFET